METNEKREKNYWGYRIDVKNQDFFFKELEQGRLRQGCGGMLKTKNCLIQKTAMPEKILVCIIM